VPSRATQQRAETTPLTPEQEKVFQQWAAQAGIGDLDSPLSAYDYRGYWADPTVPQKEKASYRWLKSHLPDTYKQHGHESFSAESKYSRGKWDGGQWLGDVLVAPPTPSHQR
jgi:hypothetical protein